MRSQYAPAQTAGDSDDDATAARNLEAGKGSGVRKKKDTGPRDVFGDLDSIVVRTLPCAYLYVYMYMYMYMYMFMFMCMYM